MNPVRNIDLEPGKYVLAVSGGVDSVALLDLLAKKAELELIAAHFDHGIRPNSKRDCDFVAILADRYGLEFYSVQGELGIGASEETARKARYDFLRKIKNKVNAKAIITAHHQDDVIETAVINIIRGTTARGLGSLKSTKEIARPILKYSKKEIIKYAEENNLQWREDETNDNKKYLRNYVRANILSKMSEASRKKLISLISTSQINHAEIDAIANSLFGANVIKRSDFTTLPHAVSCEIVANILRKNNLKIDKETVERLVAALKTTSENKKIEINRKNSFLIKNGKINLLKE